MSWKNIAELVRRGKALPQVDQNVAIEQNEEQEIEIQSKSDGDYDNKLPELEILYYESDQNISGLITRARGRNRKKVNLGVRTRSKKSHLR